MTNNNKAMLIIRDLCYIAIFAAIIAAFAQVSVPFPGGVPITLQTFAIPLAGVVLGMKKGVLATVVYVLLGAAGAPVFANLTGGIGIVLGPTGGFILSFPLLALAAGIGRTPPAGLKSRATLKKLESEEPDYARKAFTRDKLGNNVWLAMWLVIGATVNHIFGLVVFSFVTGNSLAASFGFATAPFILGDAIKIVMVVSLGGLLRQSFVKTKNL